MITRWMGVFGLGATAASSWLYLKPVYGDAACTTNLSQERKQGEDHLEAALRYVWDGTHVHRCDNPGAHVISDFISPKEAQELLAEVKPIIAQYGINLISPTHAAIYRFQQSYLPRSSQAPVNMIRVTGRPEAQRQHVAPWGYAEEFSEAALPPAVRSLAQRVRQRSSLPLGPLRDVTVNYRHSQFLRLDPHLDPAADGEHVFILGLESDTVLTLSPSRLLWLWRGVRSLANAVTLGDERDVVRGEAEHSWTPWDVDVLARARSLVHLHGPARWQWTHGTRLGVAAAAAGGRPGLDDWWGLPGERVQRAPTRHSIVLAFAAAADEQ